MNILITGSNSPLGRYFVRRMTDTFSDCRVSALCRAVPDYNHERVDYIIHDLRTDTCYSDEPFDIVIHVASVVSGSAQNTNEFRIVNYEGSIRLLKDVVLNEGATILNISSTAVYDDPLSGILSENSNKTSDNYYGISKLQFENAVVDMYTDSYVQVLNCRLPVLLVKGVRNNFMATWLEQIQTGNPITIFNPDSLFNACIGAEDIFNFFMQFMRDDLNQYLTCNLSSGSPIRIIDAARLMMDCMGKPIEIIERKAHKLAQLVSHELAVENGFQPRTVKDCIRSFIEAQTC